MLLFGRLRERLMEGRYRELVERYQLNKFPPTYRQLRFAFLQYLPVPLKPDEAFLGVLYNIFASELIERTTMVRDALIQVNNGNKVYIDALKDRIDNAKKLYEEATTTIFRLRKALDTARLNSQLKTLASALNTEFDSLKKLTPEFDTIAESLMKRVPETSKGKLGFNR